MIIGLRVPTGGFPPPLSRRLRAQASQPGRFFSYVYEIVRDDRVIYVGKGSGKRAAVSARERQGRPVIVAHFSRAEWALEFERQRIAERLAEGCRLLNVSHGSVPSWNKRADTQAMAREVLGWFAARIGGWRKAGRLSELAKILKMPADELVSLHQRFAA